MLHGIGPDPLSGLNWQTFVLSIAAALYNV